MFWNEGSVTPAGRALIIVSPTETTTPAKACR